MAKKKAVVAPVLVEDATGNKVNKSQVIRDYLAEHAEARPKDVAELLSKQLGVEISPAFVSQIKNNAKAKANGGSAKASPAKKPVASAVASNGATSPVSLIEAASAFCKLAGSPQAAKQIIEALASI